VQKTIALLSSGVASLAASVFTKKGVRATVIKQAPALADGHCQRLASCSRSSSQAQSES